jgi:tripeptide aminopeptidase
VIEDDAGDKVQGNAGNLIVNVKGNIDAPAVLLMAHMDTVVPGNGKKPQVVDGVLKSDGNTILGGDDVAGIVIILEALRGLKEQSLEHGDIQAVFTIAEEVGLLGAKNLDYGKIHSKYGFVLDSSGPIGSVAVKAPSQNNINVIIKGRAAHAGIEPENGISAISIAADAISRMKLGRIDHETTANIGAIHGGQATNIVCDKLEILAEVRSRDGNKLEVQTNHMRDCFKEAAQKFGGNVEFRSSLEYPAFSIDENSEIIQLLEKASGEAGLELKLEGIGGGSDTNILNSKDIQAVNLCIGMEKVHSVDEQYKIDNFEKAAVFLL